jgi:hypothetical protein
VLAFGDPAPGVSPAVSPLRSAEVVQAGAGTGANSTFVRSTLAFLRAQRATFAVAAARQVRLGGGRIAVDLEFSAPSPMGLLGGSGAGPVG